MAAKGASAAGLSEAQIHLLRIDKSMCDSWNRNVTLNPALDHILPGGFLSNLPHPRVNKTKQHKPPLLIIASCVYNIFWPKKLDSWLGLTHESLVSHCWSELTTCCIRILNMQIVGSYLQGQSTCKNTLCKSFLRITTFFLFHNQGK